MRDAFNNTFDRTRHFHAVAGVEFPSIPTDPSKDEVELGLSLIAEELVELFRDGFSLTLGNKLSLKIKLNGCIKATGSDYNEKGIDHKGAMDALGDLDVVINRLAGVLGYDMNKVSKAIYQSNMSKFCTTEEEAKLSVDKYADEGRAVMYEKKEIMGGDLESSTEVLYVIKDSNTGKILKSINYKEPDLASILEGK